MHIYKSNTEFASVSDINVSYTNECKWTLTFDILGGLFYFRLNVSLLIFQKYPSN